MHSDKKKRWVPFRPTDWLPTLSLGQIADLTAMCHKRRQRHDDAGALHCDSQDV